MPTIIRELPYFEKHTSVTVRGRPVTVHSYQMMLWVSVTHYAVQDLDANTPRFPAILDPGFTHNFLIRDDLLQQWAGLRAEHFTELSAIHPHGETVPLYGASVWLHPNRTGQRDEFTDAPPFRIEMESGIGICSAGMPRAPRLALLGLRGLRFANLELLIDCHRCRVTIRTRRKFWPF